MSRTKFLISPLSNNERRYETRLLYITVEPWLTGLIGWHSVQIEEIRKWNMEVLYQVKLHLPMKRNACFLACEDTPERSYLLRCNSPTEQNIDSNNKRLTSSNYCVTDANSHVGGVNTTSTRHVLHGNSAGLVNVPRCTGFPIHLGTYNKKRGNFLRIKKN